MGTTSKTSSWGTRSLTGVYDLAADEGWVSVGITCDTAQFAVNSILSWWQHLGRERYPHARSLTITADCGGSNSSRTRLWKLELQRLADETGLQIVVCHFPPATSKWNNRASDVQLRKPQLARQAARKLEVMIELIAATTTNTGLKIYAQLDDSTYDKGIEVSDDQLAAVTITRNAFHGEWNYTISPALTKS